MFKILMVEVQNTVKLDRLLLTRSIEKTALSFYTIVKLYTM